MEQETKKCPYCGEEILAVAKKCKYCGEWLKEEEQKTPKRMIPCPICCEMVEEGTEKCPHCNEVIGGNDINLSANSSVSSNTVEKIADDSRSFFDYYLWDPFFRHYVDFKGRLNRKHYWLSICVWLLSLVALLIMFPIGTLVLAPLFVVASIIPFYSTAARRMRDGDSDPGVMGWMSLFFPAIIWWLIKPTEPRMEGMEDAAPDIPQKVRFKKADKIVCLVYVLLLVIGLCVSIPSIRSYIAERNAAIAGEINSGEGIIYDPYVDYNSGNVLIKTITLTEEKTIVSFELIAEYDETWISIEEDTYIEAGNKRYKIVDASGIPFSPERRMGISANEVVNFTLIFPPIPKETEVLNIYEDDESGWHWMGIHLN